MSRLLTACAFLVLASCYFEPSGEFYKEIPEKDFSGITVNLNTVSDSLYIYEITGLAYSMQAPGFIVSEVIATMGTKIVYDGTSLENVFYINPEDFGNGTYTLTLSLKVQSGTGSLADKMVAEHVIVWKQITVIIDITPPAPVEITKIDSTNGTLTLYWEPYTKWNFQSYTVRKYCSGNDSYPCELFVINTKETNSWTDQNYVGGDVYYNLEIKAANQTHYGNLKHFRWTPDSYFTMENGKVYFHWDKPFFVQNTVSVWLETGLGQEIQINPEDTVYVADRNDMIFGVLYNDFRVKFKAGNQNGNYTLPIVYYIGELIGPPSIPPTLYSKVYNTYYGLNNWISIRAMDNMFQSMATDDLYASHKFIRIAPDGNALFTMAYDGQKSTIYQTDLLTLEHRNGHEVNGRVYDISVSNNGRLAYSASEGVRIITTQNNQMIFEYGNSNRPIALSTTAKYFFYDAKVFEFTGNDYIEQASFNTTNLIQAYFREDDFLILGYMSGKVEVIDLSTMSLVKTIQTPVDYLNSLEYDYTSNLLIAKGYEKNYVIDLDNETTTEIRTFSPYISFTNGKIFKWVDCCSFAVVDYEKYVQP